jgi:hypothetical protein
MMEMKGAYRVLMGDPEGKGPLSEPCHDWEDIIRMDIGEVGWEDVDWTGRWWALLNMVVSILVPLRVGNFLTD